MQRLSLGAQFVTQSLLETKFHVITKEVVPRQGGKAAGGNFSGGKTEARIPRFLPHKANKKQEDRQLPRAISPIIAINLSCAQVAYLI